MVPRGVSTAQPLPVSVSFGRRRLRGNRDAPLLAEIQQSLEEQGRMQVAGAAHHHAAPVIVGSDLLALPLRRHDIGLGPRGLVQHVDLFRHAVVVALAPGAEEVAGAGPAAVDLLARDQVLDVAEGIGGIVQEGRGLLRRECLGHVALADIDAARHHAAIAAGPAEARFVGVEHDAVQPLRLQLQRCIEARISGTDDGDPRLARQVDLGQGFRLVGLPPEGAGLEVLGKDVLAHAVQSAGRRPAAQALPVQGGPTRAECLDGVTAATLVWFK